MKEKASFSHISALDGIRGISIMIVFIAHLGFEHIIPGGLGVTIFFFISGFLITSLLIDEHRKSSTIGLLNFFIRRLIRLYPALLFFVLVMSTLLLFVEGDINLKELSAALFYYENYYVVFSDANLKRFQILWSLAIEEHFYLVFPFLFLTMFAKEKIFLAFMVLLVVLSLSFRVYVSLQNNVSEFSDYYNYSLTHCRADSILFGCILSLILHLDVNQKFLKMSFSPILFLGALGVLFFSLLYRDDFFRQTYKYTLQGISLLFLLPALIHGARYAFLNKLLSLKPLVYIGRLSYSIYLFHWVGLYVGLNFFSKGSVNWYVVNVVVTCFLSLVSFYYVEKPASGLRKKFGSNIT